MRKICEKGRSPLCKEEEDAISIILKCLKTRSRGNNSFSRKWFIVNEEVADKRKINCTNALEL
jgi:hypothetical protein